MPSRKIVLVAAAAVVLVVVGAVVVMVRGDGGSDGGKHEPQIRQALLDEVRPSPDCPDAAAGPELKDGEVRVNVVRVVDGCLAYSSEAVAAADLDDRLRELRDDEKVVAADRAVERQPSAAVSPRGEQPAQWALEPEHLDGEQVRNMWPAAATDVRVAVIDTGIDPEHVELADQTVDRAPWYHRYEGDYDSHGSHVGGIVAAADDGAGVVGLTPAARLIDVQYYDGRKDHLAGPTDDLGEYLRWAVDHGADVVNMSIQGTDPSDTEMTAVLYAERQGVVVVGIAGNCGREAAGHDEDWRPPWDHDENPCDRRHELKYPAAYPTVLSVAAHDEENDRAPFSSANATVDVAAPGTEILSSCLTEDGDDRVLCESSGTSQAAPYVSATAALLKARHPDATPAAIRDAITKSARTDDRQPIGTRTDEFGWGVLNPEAAAEYLDEHPGAPRKPTSSAADRTAAAFVEAEPKQLFALDDGVPHPVRPIDEEDTVRSVDWSGDHGRLVAAANAALFTWTGPGSQLVEVPCEMCDVAYIEDPSGADLVASLANDGTITTHDPATLEPKGTTTIALASPEEGFVLYGDVGGKLLIAHSIDPSSGSPDTLWLVDPSTGEASGSHSAEGTGVAPVAVDAADERVAYVTDHDSATCGDRHEIFLLDGADLAETAAVEAPESDLGALEPEDIFFNGEALYATMMAWGPDGDLDCTEVASAGLWRLDDDAGGWEQVDEEPVRAVRPLEGLTEDPGTGRLAISDEDSRGTFEPTGASGSTHVQFGDVHSIWATPTRDEVDLGRKSSTPPVEEPEDPDPGQVPNTTEAAIARFEDYLHALGEGDVDTLCEIAGPAAKIAEDQGFGPCESTFGTVVDDMISPEQAEALKAATVDPDKVDASTPGRVQFPVEAVVASMAFTEEDLGSYTLVYQDGNWFMVE